MTLHNERGRPLDQGGLQITGQVDRPEGTALAWLTGELRAIEEKLSAARATIDTRGIVPRPALRSATVQLVALDAAVTDLAVVRTMPDAICLDTGRFDHTIEVES